MDALRRAKSERGGHRGIVTKTITELDILLANPADPNDLAASTKQLKSLNVYKMKLERERDALPAFDEKVQAELTDGQELEDDIIEAEDIQTIGRFCKPNPVRFSERSASGFWPGRVKVHTNMCKPKVCSANRKLIFGFIFGSASSDGEATGDFKEDFGGNPVALESQSDKVVLARKNVFFFFLPWLALQGSAGRDW